MKKQQDIKILDYSYQHNGLCGRGFHTIRFEWKYDTNLIGRFIAILFPTSDSEGYETATFTGECAVLREKPYGPINLEQHWRGDSVESSLRDFIVWRQNNYDYKKYPKTFGSPPIEEYYSEEVDKLPII